MGVRPRGLRPEEDHALEDYLSLQGRFKTLLSDPVMLERVRAAVEERWDVLVERHERSALAIV